MARFTTIGLPSVMNLVCIMWVGFGKLLFGFFGYDTVGWYAFGLGTLGTICLLIALGITAWGSSDCRRRRQPLSRGQRAAQVGLWISLLLFGLTAFDSISECRLPSILAAVTGKTTTDDPITARQRYQISTIDVVSDWTSVTALILGAIAGVTLLVMRRRSSTAESQMAGPG